MSRPSTTGSVQSHTEHLAHSSEGGRFGLHFGDVVWPSCTRSSIASGRLRKPTPWLSSAIRHGGRVTWSGDHRHSRSLGCEELGSL